MAKAKRLKRTGQRIDKVSGRFGSSYKKSFVRMAEIMGRAGMIDSEVAAHFGVTTRTLLNWKAWHPEFAKALLIGKEVADNRVEQSLYHMALGYEVAAEEIKIINGEVVRVQTTKHIPAQPLAAISWLNNRRRDQWQRNPEPDDAPPPPEEAIDITPENARQIARRFALTLVKSDKVA